FEEAHHESTVAIAAIETIRTSVVASGLRASYFASVKQHYDLQIDLLMRIAAASTLSSPAAAAFESSERGRARGLLESFSEPRVSISGGANRELLDREVSLRTALEAKSEQYAQILSRTSDAKAIASDRKSTRLNSSHQI